MYQEKSQPPSNWLILIAFLGWVFTTAATGIYVKDFLNQVPFPFFITFGQAFAGSILTFLYLGTTKNIQKPYYTGCSNLEIISVFGGLFVALKPLR